MDRTRWLAERRAEVEKAYTDEGPTYDEYDPATPTHRDFVSRLIGMIPRGGSILDAACGTAPYAGQVREANLLYVGIDQSAGMLERAQSKWPEARFERIGLQELAFDGSFHGVMCIDAMEHVPPEDWPVVLSAFRKALLPSGHGYLTLEQIERSQIEDANARAIAQGSPAVSGEVLEGDTAGYHFYPDQARVDRWLADAGFETVATEDEWLDGYSYRHLLLRAD